MIILSFNYGHDSSACLLVDGEIKAAIAEERLTRTKNDACFPLNAIQWVLEWSGVRSEEVDILVSAGQNFRLDARQFFELPKSFDSGLGAAKSKIKGYLKNKYFRGLGILDGELPLYCQKFSLKQDVEVITVEHHLAHAASAYFTAGMGDDKCLIATLDGIGDVTSTALWIGERNRITPLRSYGGESSIGWFYGNATEALGWRHGSDEWKVMGLAPYGQVEPGALRGFYPEFTNGQLTRPHDFGSFDIWRDHGSCHFHGRDSISLQKIAERMGKENFSAEVQRTVEEQMLSLLTPALREINTRKICCAGGCFLNVKFNQKLWYSGEVDDQWIYPDPADAGLSVGAALFTYYQKRPTEYNSRLTNLYWGPEFSDHEIEKVLKERGLVYCKPDDLSDYVANLLVKNYAVGWFQGRMEAGPRALGGRSILMSPLVADNKDRINAKVKYREAFRPFCPSMPVEERDNYLKNARDERFMISSFEVTEQKKSSIPAVVHVDGTVRPQLVYPETNPRYHSVIKTFGQKTGEAVILNTSFNVKGEPIVCNPREAIKCFFDTGLEGLVLGSFVLTKPALS